MKIAIVFVVALLAGCASVTTEQRIVRISDVLSREHIDIYYLSLSCFTYDRYMLSYYPEGEGYLKVKKAQISKSGELCDFESEKTFTVRLCKGEKRKLDNAISKYRNNTIDFWEPGNPFGLIVLARKSGDYIVCEEVLSNVQPIVPDEDTLSFEEILNVIKRKTT